MASQALGLAGGVIGGYFGGPVGAQIGFAAGSTLGSFLDPPDPIQGPKIGEVPHQTGRDGVAIPWGWGIIHTAGNILMKNEAQIVEVEESSGGKGGGSTVVSERLLRTFSIGVCRGPIKAILRIWQNDKLVYDAREAPEIAAEDHQAYADQITIYLGGEDQLPDPELESQWGVDTTPAFRGLAYIVWNNFDLTDFGKSIPQYRFEVQIDGAERVTSTPYPVQALDKVSPIVTITGGGLYELPSDQGAVSVAPVSLEMRQLLKTTGPYPDQGAISVTPVSLEMRQILKSTGPYPDQGAVSVAPVSLEMVKRLVATEIPGEKVATTVTISGGSMTLI